MANPPPQTVGIRDLVSNAEIMRLLSEKEAKISVTFKGKLMPLPDLTHFEGKFDMYLSYFDGSWTVSKWEATWNRENTWERGYPDVDWARPINYFAHMVVLLVDKITEK